MPCGAPCLSRRRAVSRIAFLSTRRPCSPAWTWPALTAWQTSWKTRRFSLPGASRVVIIPDVNLLLYGVVSAFPQHKPAHAWWEGTINSAAEIGLPSPAIFGFVRIATSPRVLAPPIAVEAAMGYVSAWLGQPNVSRLVPGRRHIEIASGLLHGVGTGGNLTTDVQLAALALESDADMYSNDTDFARFPGLRWVNLLA